MTREEKRAILNDCLKRMGSDQKVDDPMLTEEAVIRVLELVVCALEENVKQHNQLDRLAMAAYNR